MMINMKIVNLLKIQFNSTSTFWKPWKREAQWQFKMIIKTGKRTIIIEKSQKYYMWIRQIMPHSTSSLMIMLSRKYFSRLIFYLLF